MDEHQFDRRATDANVSSLALRVAGLESRMEVMEKNQAANARELLANTALTRQVHTNTEAIVDAVQSLAGLWEWCTKWGRRLSIFAKYATPIVTFIAAIIAALHLRK